LDIWVKSRVELNLAKNMETKEEILGTPWELGEHVENSMGTQ